jgi:5-methylcytosine-specific restriction endonuclease McrA
MNITESLKLKPMFWKAAPYLVVGGTWRQGKIHRISSEDQGKTLCGKILSEFAGEIVEAAVPNCKICARSPAVQARREAQEEEWRQRSQQYEEERHQQAEERKREYDAYMQSTKWAHIRQRVLERENYVCQGCGIRGAIQAHHLTYDRFKEEMLFDLVAVCRSCHERIHNLL